jgi:hypothetical protein
MRGHDESIPKARRTTRNRAYLPQSTGNSLLRENDPKGEEESDEQDEHGRATRNVAGARRPQHQERRSQY